MHIPLVSVVTPFYNTAHYLAECIESVLGQNFSDFEYILADNCSTDGSAEIAESYARRDRRIHLIRYSAFLPQLENYNRALSEISNASRYCKIVQADDTIFPECLKLMVQTFEQSESIGLVGSYRLSGTFVEGSGYPFPMPVFSGGECGRLYLRTGTYFFGSQSTVMYRSSLVRVPQPFFDPSVPCADLKKCLEILGRWDFGFVHQVLSFSRPDSGNQSVTSARRSFQPFASDRYLMVQQFAPLFLEAGEAARLRRLSKRSYYRLLAHEVFGVPRAAFWQYHRRALRTIGEALDWPYLTLQVLLLSLWKVGNPGRTARELVEFWNGGNRR